MSRRLVLGLTWLAATVIAVFVALQAVGAVGDQVTNTPTAAGRRAAATSTSTTSTTPTTSSTTSAPLPSEPAPASVSPAAAPSTPDAPSPDPASSADPESAPATQPREQPVQEQVPAEDQPEDAPAAGPTTSYTLEGGSIGVRCTGSTIELVYSSPAQGFGSEVNSSGPSEVDVRFESDSHRSRIKVQCSAGTPVVTDQREEPS